MANPQHAQKLLSVAMIVRDEATTLPATLDCVAQFADEILIVDTGSRDSTHQVATERGAIVSTLAWDDSFSAARNRAFSLCTGQWVLWLDAGETLTADDAHALRGFLETNADPNTAYALLVQVPCVPGNASGEQAARLRLVPNREGITYVGRVRESMSTSLAALGMNTEGLPWRIQRGQREHDPDVKSWRAQRNLILAERAIREMGATPSLFNCLGESLAALGRHQRARECFAHAKQTAEPGSSDLLEACYGLLSSLDHAGGDFRSQQLNICLEALAAFPLDAQLLCAMGGYLQAQGRPDLACRSYETAFRYGQANPEIWHLTDIEEIAAVCYSLSLQLQDRDEEARRVVQEAVESHPRSPRLRRHLLEVLVKLGERTEALRQLDHLPLEHGQRDALIGAVRGACLAAEKNWMAARAYLKTSLEQGCRDPLALRWYVATQLALGEYQAALTIVQEWLAAEPESMEALQLAHALAQQAAEGQAEAERAQEVSSQPGAAPRPERRIDAATATAGERRHPLGTAMPPLGMPAGQPEPPASV